MITISRCPYRISLLGGGSDLDWFLKDNHSGICLGYSLSKYTYTVINKLPSRAKRGILNYSSREEYSNVDEIAHPLIRLALEEINFSELLEISSFGFASRGSGLGGSSSFLLALLKGLSKMKNANLSNFDLAYLASNIEINKLKKPIGRQDHFISSTGSISCFKFVDDNNTVEKITLNNSKKLFLKNLTEKLYLIPSFVSRSADKVLYKLKDSSTANYELLEIRKIAEKFINSSENREYVIEETFNSCVRESWEIKKNMSGVMTGVLNDQYNQLNKLPLNWIRLLGAGSGGYFLISTKLDNKTTEEKLINLGMKDFFQASMSQSGLEIIHDYQ